MFVLMKIRVYQSNESYSDVEASYQLEPTIQMNVRIGSWYRTVHRKISIKSPDIYQFERVFGWLISLEAYRSWGHVT